jgi:hypothetical protein
MGWRLTEDSNMEGSGRMLTHDLQRYIAPQYFYYNAALRILICKEHHYTVLPGNGISPIIMQLVLLI